MLSSSLPCACCSSLLPISAFVPTEVPQAAAHLEVRVLHRLCPGGVSSSAQEAAYRCTGTKQQQQQLLQQLFGQFLSSALWHYQQRVAAACASQHCCWAVCSACNSLEQVERDAAHWELSSLRFYRALVEDRRKCVSQQAVGCWCARSLRRVPLSPVLRWCHSNQSSYCL